LAVYFETDQIAAMPKIKQSPKLPPEERREQLLCAAKKLFVKKGYRGTTTDENARKAGLTKGALYYHFKKKEDILFELVQEMCNEHGRAMHTSEGTLLTPVDIIRVLMRVYDSKDMADYRQVVDIWAQAIRIPRIKRFLADEYVQAIDDIQSRLDKRFGRSGKTRRQLAVFTVALHEGLAVHKMMNPDLVDIPAQTRLFERMLEAIDSPSDQKRKKRGIGK